MTEQQAAPKKNNRPRNLLIAIGGSVVAVCMCLFAAFINNRLQTLSPAGQQTSTSKAIAVITQNAPTAVPSETPTKTPRPTSTATNTPLPPETQTAQAIEHSQTVAALQATATRKAYDTGVTATAQSISGTATEIASYGTIANGELITYADNHIGEKVRIYGRVFNIIDLKTLQIYLSGTYDAVYVDLRIALKDVFEDNSITIYGTIAGQACGENAFGGTICQPRIIDAFYVR